MVVTIKNQSDEELINLANELINNADKENNLSIILMIIMLFQILLTVFEVVRFGFLTGFIMTFVFGTMLYHFRRRDKNMEIVNEIINELNFREKVES